jgi:predicted nuclease with TOPRIM domain
MVKRIIKDIFDSVFDFDKVNEEENNSLREEVEQQRGEIKQQRDLIDRLEAENNRLRDAIKRLLS